MTMVRLSTCAACVVGWATLAPIASADDKVECVRAADAAQELRSEGRIVAAREQFITCSQSRCPVIVRKDCAAWLAEVEAALPTVVFNARDADGHDVIRAEVSLDGQPLPNVLDGRAVTVDPGVHKVRLTTPDGAALDTTVVVHSGERNLNIRLTIGPAGRKAYLPTASLVLGIVGAVGIAGDAIFGIKGFADVNDLKSGCGKTHTCSPSSVTSAETELHIGDISLAVGLASLAAAATVYFVADSSHVRPPVAAAFPLTIDLKSGGGFVRWMGEF